MSEPNRTAVLEEQKLRRWLARPAGVRPLADALGGLLGRIERHASLPLVLLACVYVPAVLHQSRSKLLWHDELFTLYIAQQPTWSAMLHAIQRVDLNPPLSYVLARLCLHVFPHSALAVRVPEMVAFAVAMFALYEFVRHRLGAAFGMLAASFLLSSLAGELAFDARPYSLLLAFNCLSLLGWQKVWRGRSSRGWGLALLFLGSAGMLLSHLFGLVTWAALGAGEIVRWVRSSRADTPSLIAWTAPLVTTVSYLPMLRNHGAGAFPSAFQPTGEDVFRFYISHIDRELVALGLTILLVLVAIGKNQVGRRSAPTFATAEWASIGGLLAAPGAILLYLFLVHGAFFPRYGVSACIGVAVVASVLLWSWTCGAPKAALLGCVVALLISGQLGAAVAGTPDMVRRPTRLLTERLESTCEVCNLTSALDARLPIVAASGLTFLEMDHRLRGEEVTRLFYLTDHDAALRLAHATIFEGLPEEARLFPVRANVAAYTEFLQTHPRFFVFGDFGYPEDWLLRKLLEDGLDLRLLGQVGGSYKDHQLYLVTARDR